MLGNDKKETDDASQREKDESLRQLFQKKPLL